MSVKVTIQAPLGFKKDERASISNTKTLREPGVVGVTALLWLNKTLHETCTTLCFHIRAFKCRRSKAQSHRHTDEHGNQAWTGNGNGPDNQPETGHLPPWYKETLTHLPPRGNFNLLAAPSPKTLQGFNDLHFPCLCVGLVRDSQISRVVGIEN